MGRPKKIQDGVITSFRVPQEDLTLVKRIMADTGEERADVLRRGLREGLRRILAKKHCR